MRLGNLRAWEQPPDDHVFVRTNESEAAAAARIGAGLAVRRRAELMGALKSCFARTQTWQQAGKYISALVSELPKRNGWTMAQHAGDRSPDRMQRLLNRASWDTLAAMSGVRRFAADGLAQAARRGRRRGGLVIAAVDETGQEKADRFMKASRRTGAPQRGHRCCSIGSQRSRVGLRPQSLASPRAKIDAT